MFRVSTLAVMICTLSACGASTRASHEAAPASPQTPSPEAQCLANTASAGAVPADAPSRVTVSHILIRYSGAKRATDEITRNRGEACLRAMAALDGLKQGRDFGELAGEMSDERGAGSRGGSIGSIEVEDVEPAFAAAAFALDINQVSQVVETEFGFHLILRSN